MFTDYTCQRQKLQKGDFYFPIPLHFFSSWPLSASPKYFFSLKPRGSLWKQQRGRFPMFRMMRNHIYSGWFMPKFPAQFGAGVDFALFRCYQQEPQPQNVSTASETTFTFPCCLSWGCFPLVPVDAEIQPFSPCTLLRGWSHQLLLRPGAGPVRMCKLCIMIYFS